MLDLRAAGECRGAHRAFVSMHKRPQAQLPGFVACGVELLLRERHAAALTDALRGENFDEIGAGGFLFADEGANLFGRPARLAAPD